MFPLFKENEDDEREGEGNTNKRKATSKEEVDENEAIINKRRADNSYIPSGNKNVGQAINKFLQVVQTLCRQFLYSFRL